MSSRFNSWNAHKVSRKNDSMTRGLQDPSHLLNMKNNLKICDWMMKWKQCYNLQNKRRHVKLLFVFTKYLFEKLFTNKIIQLHKCPSYFRPYYLRNCNIKFCTSWDQQMREMLKYENHKLQICELLDTCDQYQTYKAP